MPTLSEYPELTLDPGNWDEFRRLAHTMVDHAIDSLETVRDRPVWRPIPPEVTATFQQELPADPQPLNQVYAEFRQRIFPYPKGSFHPRFWGWVEGAGTATGMMADMLAACMNGPAAGFQQSPTFVELQVLDWFKAILGYPGTASGLLVSGGSMANLTGLAVARSAKAAVDIRAQGLQAQPRPLILYASAEVHNSVTRSAELLGLGSASVRSIPVNADFRINIDALRDAIRADLDRHMQPFCIVGTAGTVNTGAVDDLDALASLAREYDLWLHVDGAIGAMACLAPSLRPMFRGIERADSIAFDLHKWTHVPYQVGCLLVRSPEAHYNAFSSHAHYLSGFTRGVTAAPVFFADYGIELSRSFRALKIWMTFMEHGTRKLGRLMEQNVRQIHYLESLVRAHPGFEVLAPPSLSIFCFRFIGPQPLPEPEINALNQELLMQLQESGVAVISSTVLGGRLALRVANTNHRTRSSDFDALIETIARLGTVILNSRRPTSS